MPRPKATRHCKACRYYLAWPEPGKANRSTHFCMRKGRIKNQDARTSPPWCPLGHYTGEIVPAFGVGADFRPIIKED